MPAFHPLPSELENDSTLGNWLTFRPILIHLPVKVGYVLSPHSWGFIEDSGI